MRMNFRYRFEAAHRFLNSSSPKCQTPHGHTWWIEFSLGRGEPGLDHHGMVAEFGWVKGWIRAWVEESLDHSFLHHWQDPLLASLRENVPSFRGLPFPEDPTTEWLTYLASRKVRSHLLEVNKTPEGKGLVLLGIKVEETPTNSVELGVRDLVRLDEALSFRLGGLRGWWDDPSPGSRILESSPNKPPKNLRGLSLIPNDIS